MSGVRFVLTNAIYMHRVPGVSWRIALVSSCAMWRSLQEQAAKRERRGGPL